MEKLPESIESSRFVSHRARLLGEFDSRKGLQSTRFERRPQVFVKLSFRELCNSKWSSLYAFNNMAIIQLSLNWLKIERKVVSSWDTNPWSNVCDPHWELICQNKWHQGTSEISIPPEIAVGMHFHAQTWH